MNRLTYRDHVMTFTERPDFFDVDILTKANFQIAYISRAKTQETTQADLIEECRHVIDEWIERKQ